MSWIKTITYNEAKGTLKSIYNRIKGPNNTIDNVLTIHSLRPHTLKGHMVLYKSVLHHAKNTLPKWYLEALGVYTSYLNNCDYCFQHHLAGLTRLWDNEPKAKQFEKAIKAETLATFFDPKWMAGITYCKTLTLNLGALEKRHIEALRQVGFSDGEILEINQVVSYFNYVNRSVVGLGVNLTGDVLGLSPKNNDDPENWAHT